MAFADIKNFFKDHRNDFKQELEGEGITLINFVDFEDVAKRHTSTLKVRAFAEFVKNNTPGRNLNNPNAKEFQAVDQKTV